MTKIKYEKLPKKFKKEWLKELRGSNFTQSNEFLRTRDNRYSALGIAAKISGCESITCKNFIMGYSTVGTLRVRYFKNAPKQLIGGLENPIVVKLTNMSLDGKSFKHIAKWIEKTL